MSQTNTAFLAYIYNIEAQLCLVLFYDIEWTRLWKCNKSFAIELLRNGTDKSPIRSIRDPLQWDMPETFVQTILLCMLRVVFPYDRECDWSFTFNRREYICPIFCIPDKNGEYLTINSALLYQGDKAQSYCEKIRQNKLSLFAQRRSIENRDSILFRFILFIMWDSFTGKFIIIQNPFFVWIGSIILRFGFHEA